MVGATVVVGAPVVVGAGWLQAIAGPTQVPGGTTTGRTVVDVDVDVDVVDVEVVVVGKPHAAPLSVLVLEPLAPSEPVQFVVTVTAPAGRGAVKVFVGPTHVSDVTVPLIVTVAVLVPEEGNAE